MKKNCILLSFMILIANSLQGQTKTMDPFREMEEQMQQLIQQFQQGMSFSLPNTTDTTLFFKWDTSYQGGNGNGFLFRMNPPSGQQLNDAFGWDELMKELKEFSDQIQLGYFPENEPLMPSDDGAMRNKEGESIPLPEEQLREAEKNQEMTPKSAPPAKPKKPAVKTTRI